MTEARRRQPTHPHGWLGYVVADPRRTANAVRLARWAVLALTIIAAAAVAIAFSSPFAAAALLAAATTASSATVRLCRYRIGSRKGPD